jgi:hypothetical protein
MHDTPNKMENNWTRLRHLLLLFIQHYAFRIYQGRQNHECKNPNDDLVDHCSVLHDIENELGGKLFETERQRRKAITSIWW